MAKERKAKGQTERLAEGTVPEGYMTIPTGSRRFYTFDVIGQEVIGRLVGQDTFKVTKQDGSVEDRLRWVLLPNGRSETVVLPDFYDLNAGLALAWEQRGQDGVEVFVKFLGYESVPKVKSGKMARFAVGAKPLGEALA